MTHLGLGSADQSIGSNTLQCVHARRRALHPLRVQGDKVVAHLVQLILDLGGKSVGNRCAASGCSSQLASSINSAIEVTEVGKVGCRHRNNRQSREHKFHCPFEGVRRVTPEIKLNLGFIASDWSKPLVSQKVRICVKYK